MYLKVFILFSCTTLLCWGSIPDCPKDDGDDPSKPVLYPDPDDCGAFFECASGSAYRFFCYPGLYYNIETEKCDYIEDVHCGTRPTTLRPPTTTSTPEITTTTA